MGETNLYMTTKPLNQFGTHVKFDALGAPPGTSMPSSVAELLRGLAEQLVLPSVGISTPWATRTSDLDWQEIRNPDTNVQTYILQDVDLARAQQAMFGQPVPFVVIKTLDPVPQAALEAAAQGSAYEFYETQAVYRQDDKNPIPRIEFFNWMRRVPLDEEGGKPMGQVASELNGDLQFGLQVPVESTTSREAPTISFQEAYDAQFLPAPPGGDPVPPVPEAPVPVPDPEAPAPEPEKQVPVPRAAAQPSWAPLLVAGTIAVAGVVLWQTTRKRR